MSLKYSEENQLVLINLLRGYGLLSRDGRSNSCDPYVIIEIKYSEEKPHGSTTQKYNRMASIPDNNESKPAGRRVTRSHSLQHAYNHVSSTHKHLTIGYHGQVSTSQYGLHVEHQSGDAIDDEETSEPVSKLMLKHEVSTSACSKTIWWTQNPEFNELFLFHAPKDMLVSASLAVTVMDRKLIGEDLCIGNIAIPLGSLSITGIQSIPPQWFTVRKVNYFVLFIQWNLSYLNS